MQSPIAMKTTTTSQPRKRRRRERRRAKGTAAVIPSQQQQTKRPLQQKLNTPGAVTTTSQPIGAAAEIPSPPTTNEVTSSSTTETPTLNTPEAETTTGETKEVKGICICKVTVDTVYKNQAIHVHCPQCKPDTINLGNRIKYKDFLQHQSKFLEHGPNVDLDVDLEMKLTSLMQPLERSSAAVNMEDARKLFPQQKMCAGILRDESLDEKLRYELECKILNVSYQHALVFRTTLPVYAMKEQILGMIDGNRVSLISGETGSGKTTQVAQFILDDHIRQQRGSVCRIICTQPRRISAISVAERVAKERGEEIGESTGYVVRLDLCYPREQGSITFCTPGVLLQMFIEDPLMSRVSHIIIDEVHKRDILTDFLLIVVKQALLRDTGLKITLMSATIDTEKFSKYFFDCPVLDIPGHTHPVQEIFLEQLLGLMNLKPLPPKLASMKHQRRYPRKDNCEQYYKYVSYLKRTGLSPKDEMYLMTMDYSRIPHDLIVETASYICQRTPSEEAILVFLPGWKDIERQMLKFRADPRFQSREQFLIIPIHSKLDTALQKEVFVKPPAPVRKIILGTNIVETSITIDDIVHIIDSGKAKESTYDANMSFSILSCGWVSRASLKQRLGRAGRVKPGTCYRMFTKQHLKSCQQYRTPDIMVKPLSSLCLMAKVLAGGKIWPFLLKAVNPPPHAAFKAAVKRLVQIKALDENENLTVLGYCLAHLPVEPHIGRMMVYGSLFSCLDPILSIATIVEGREASALLMSEQSAWSSALSQFKNRDAVPRFGLQKRGRSDHAREFKSDHISMMKEFHEWEELDGDEDAQASYARACGLQNDVLRMKLAAKNQFTLRLYKIGMIAENDAQAPQYNVNSNNIPLIKAVLCSGLYPNIAVIKPILNDDKRWQKLKKFKSHERDLNSMSSRDIIPAFFMDEQAKNTAAPPQVLIHPTSSAQKHLDKSSQFLLYTELIKTDLRYYIFDVTTASSYSILLFGGHLELSAGNITVGGLRFPGSQKTIKIFSDARQHLDRILAEKLKKNRDVPSDANENIDENILLTIIDMLSTEDRKPVVIAEGTDGFSGIPNKVPRLSLDEDESLNKSSEYNDYSDNRNDNEYYEGVDAVKYKDWTHGECPSSSLRVEGDDVEEDSNYTADEQPTNHTADEKPTNYVWQRPGGSLNTNTKLINRGLGGVLF